MLVEQVMAGRSPTPEQVPSPGFKAGGSVNPWEWGSLWVWVWGCAARPSVRGLQSTPCDPRQMLSSPAVRSDLAGIILCTGRPVAPSLPYAVWSLSRLSLRQGGMLHQDISAAFHDGVSPPQV